RAGLVWGPFSPIYGAAASVMLLILEPFLALPTLVLFLVAGVVGGGLEYLAHWAMETFWGVVAWSYQDWPCNFNGRTDLAHSILWGAIGVLWLRLGVPICDKIFAHVNVESLSYKVISSCLAVFMVVNIFFTVTSLLRADERTREIPPNDVIDEICDTYLPDEYLRSRFNNMGGLGIR
ncbi:MAG: putative ABC transporter permease, partial [Anaerotardibacter sp.]